VALQEYRRKRRFTETPEPEGTPAAAPGASFVVQMHSARRLHFDLRLEIDGDLKSWAVPRGPSMNPADKRLAVRTEDHPLQYLTFEAVIPPGNYGAGPMMVWDSGEFQPEGGLPPAQQMARGELKFRLRGRKLRGGFVLVKTKGDKEWLLLKHNDEWADPNWTIEPLNRSVLTTRSLEEIDGGEPPPPETPMPRRVEPMLATLVDQAFSDPNWLFELKWDGMRALTRLEDGRWELWSRTGRDARAQFPELEALAELAGPRRCILDGEIVVLNSDGRADFERMQSRMHSADPSAALVESAPITYYLFDILYCDGMDLRSVPLLQRKEFLKQVVAWRPPLRYSDHVREQGRELFELARQREVEGVIGKRLDSVYVSGRSADWVKLKVTRELEAVIGGYTAPRGGQRFGALLVGLYDNGRLCFIGGVGTGYTQRTQEEVWRELEQRRVERCPFADYPKTKEQPFWVRPELVARVKYGDFTHERRLRAPVYLGLRADLDPRACRLEIEQAAPPPPPQSRPVSSVPVLRSWPEVEDELLRGRAANVVVEIDGRDFRLTNLNKVYYPQQGYSKRRVLAYYYQISDCILPFLRNRPMVLRRTPDGITGGQFFQKDAGDDAPPWIDTAPVPSDRRKDTPYFLCNDLAALLFLTNLGCIEHNPWASSVGSLDRPDYLFFDLDPVEGTAYDTVVEVAAGIQKLLRQLRLRAFLKISGATGFHLWLPVEPVYSFEQVRTFTEIVARVIASRMPDQVTLERSVGKRDQGKVYIDYSQNGQGRPLTVVYSARPFPGAPASAPVSEKELRPGLNPADFNIVTLPERVRKTGDLWKDFWNSRQRLEPPLERLKEELAKPAR
jgi:bifunctional non-homologous end joining protein LigD